MRDIEKLLLKGYLAGCKQRTGNDLMGRFTPTLFSFFRRHLNRPGGDAIGPKASLPKELDQHCPA
jgi:hypothetical protein